MKDVDDKIRLNQHLITRQMEVVMEVMLGLKVGTKNGPTLGDLMHEMNSLRFEWRDFSKELLGCRTLPIVRPLRVEFTYTSDEVHAQLLELFDETTAAMLALANTSSDWASIEVLKMSVRSVREAFCQTIIPAA